MVITISQLNTMKNIIKTLTVDLYFNISEGDITKINKIIINGNKSILVDDIRDIIKSKTKSIVKFLPIIVRSPKY